MDVRQPNPVLVEPGIFAWLKEKPKIFSVAKLCQKASKRATTDRKYRKGWKTYVAFNNSNLRKHPSERPIS
jgi:hypothetical protein